MHEYTMNVKLLGATCPLGQNVYRFLLGEIFELVLVVTSRHHDTHPVNNDGEEEGFIAMMCEEPEVQKFIKNDESPTLLGELKKHLKGRN